MRDEKRIDPFLDKLKEYWHMVPDWRFGQLICNVLGTAKIDPFFIEEKDMIKLFEEYFKPDQNKQGDSVQLFELDFQNKEALIGIDEDSAEWYPIEDIDKKPYVNLNKEKYYL